MQQEYIITKNQLNQLAEDTTLDITTVNLEAYRCNALKIDDLLTFVAKFKKFPTDRQLVVIVRDGIDKFYAFHERLAMLDYLQRQFIFSY